MIPLYPGGFVGIGIWRIVFGVRVLRVDTRYDEKIRGRIFWSGYLQHKPPEQNHRGRRPKLVNSKRRAVDAI